MLQAEKNKTLAIQWRNSWALQSFRIKAVAGSVLLAFVLVSFPGFFARIELRQGVILNDWLLEQIPAADVSVPVFILIWSSAILLVSRIIKDPVIFLEFLLSFLLLCITRIITISFFALEPPAGLIELKDPVSSLFYGGQAIFIKKDLFYSGHTATQFLMFLTLTHKRDKLITAFTTICIAVLVLVQHIHYTIDVVAAFPFAYLVHLAGKKMAGY